MTIIHHPTASLQPVTTIGRKKVVFIRAKIMKNGELTMLKSEKLTISFELFLDMLILYTIYEQ